MRRGIVQLEQLAKEGRITAMTSQDYRAAIRALGYTPVKPTYNGATLYVGRDGMHTTIPDPEGLSPEEREGMIAFLKMREGLSSH
jgi:hypothetical protein